jgi:hypothetical protein
MKSCSKCGAEHDRNHNWCLACVRAYNKDWRKRNRDRCNTFQREFRHRHPHKTRATRAVTKAIASGRLVRPSTCSECGTSCKPEAHHDDYSKPLGVRWLCRPCHLLFHERERASRQAAA